MKRIMPMAVAGLFVATAAFATVGHETPLVNQDNHAITDTIPDQQQTPPATFPTQTEPAQTDTEPTPMVTEPTKTDDENQVDDTTAPVLQPTNDTTDTDTTGGF